MVKMLVILLFALILSGATKADWVTAGDDMYTDITGGVGIGTTTPTEKLTVGGNIAARGTWREPDSGIITGKWEGNAVYGELEWFRTGRNPFEPFHVTLAKSYGYLGGLEVDRSVFWQPGHAIGVYGVAVKTTWGMSGYGGYFVGEGPGHYGVYGHATNTGDTQNHGGYFKADGQRGTGIYAKGGEQGYAGEFDGPIRTTVLEITGGADLSEQFEIRCTSSDSKPSAGMVVSIDPANPGKLLVSNKAYDRRVAGIISGAGDVSTGMLMGQRDSKADGKSPVALTGRVYCCVDASSGSIEPGDLLTTSDVPGHAMKVTDFVKSQGATIGKAMTGLEKGKGLVLVLVTLQ